MKGRRPGVLAALVVAAAAVLLASGATRLWAAEEWGGRQDETRGRGGFERQNEERRGRAEGPRAPEPARREDWSRHADIRRFPQEDMDRWRGGHWFRGNHEGREGWWWIVGNTWYLYPQPVYPYPDPYVPPAAPPPPQAAAQVWYYCASAQNYYPYVTSCPEGWQPVPAQPGAPPS